MIDYDGGSSPNHARDHSHHRQAEKNPQGMVLSSLLPRIGKPSTKNNSEGKNIEAKHKKGIYDNPYCTQNTPFVPRFDITNQKLPQEFMSLEECIQ